MSNHKWQVGPVKLVNGCEATIHRFCEKRQRYIGEQTGILGRVYAAEWNIAGEYTISGISYPLLNLAPPPKKKVRVQLWVNVYPGGALHVHKNRVHAESDAGVNRIACKEIDIEVEEGEGL
jgi:hypothetical protein